MSDTKLLLRQGFIEVDKTSSGFSLLAMKLNKSDPDPKFNDSVRSGTCEETNGIVVYYSNRCPFAEFRAQNSLIETAKNRGLACKVIKLKTMEEAQIAPSPASIFSMFYEDRFLTTDLSACMDSRFDKILEKSRM